MNSKTNLQVSIETLCSGFLERDEIVRSTVVAAIAGQHTFLLGEPGTAKSMIARTVSAAFGGRYFETLLTRFSTMEDVFGPTMLSALKDDRYARAIENYLPCADVSFLDEIFKGNAGIVNSLLTCLNERKFHNDGKIVNTPLVTCIAASNELPESDELNALYDRFLVRHYVAGIQEQSNVREMLKRVANGFRPTIAQIDVRAEQAQASVVEVSDETLDTQVDLWQVCRNSSLKVSDRRWNQCIALIKAEAHVAGRKATVSEDLEILQHVLWKKPDERVQIAQAIQKTVNPHAAKAVAEMDAAKDLFSKLPNADTAEKGSYLAAIGQAVQDLTMISKRIEKLPTSKKQTQAFDTVKEIKAKVTKLALKASGVEL